MYVMYMYSTLLISQNFNISHFVEIKVFFLPFLSFSSSLPNHHQFITSTSTSTSSHLQSEKPTSINPINHPIILYLASQPFLRAIRSCPLTLHLSRPFFIHPSIEKIIFNLLQPQLSSPTPSKHPSIPSSSSSLQPSSLSILHTNIHPSPHPPLSLPPASHAPKKGGRLR